MRSVASVAGGDINQAGIAILEDGARVFVKWHSHGPSGMFEAEARGLRWLAEASALRIPGVIGLGREPSSHTDFLALEHLASKPKRADFDAHLGHGLAMLHRTGAPTYGFETDNFIGTLPQANQPHESWASFYRSCRLEPQLARAADRLPRTMRRRFDRLLDALDARFDFDEGPSRLHGDLWGGNVLVDERGLPALIDPAVYGGHREVDLAMMRLFGGFGPKVFAAYDEAWPLADGFEERIPFYQLYPLLVHVNLFGSAYLGSVEAALTKLGV